MHNGTLTLVATVLIVGVSAYGVRHWRVAIAHAMAPRRRQARINELESQLTAALKVTADRREERAALIVERNQLAKDGKALRALATDFYATWAEADRDADAWWERYTAASEMAHNYACQLSAATAHDAEVLDEPLVDDLPPFREVPDLLAIEAACPVSPAPVCDFASPTGSWSFVELRAAIGAGASA